MKNFKIDAFVFGLLLALTSTYAIDSNFSESIMWRNLCSTGLLILFFNRNLSVIETEFSLSRIEANGSFTSFLREMFERLFKILIAASFLFSLAISFIFDHSTSIFKIGLFNLISSTSIGFFCLLNYFLAKRFEFQMPTRAVAFFSMAPSVLIITSCYFFNDMNLSVLLPSNINQFIIPGISPIYFLLTITYSAILVFFSKPLI